MNNKGKLESKTANEILKMSESYLTKEESATLDDRSKLNVIRKIQLNMLQKIKNNEPLPTFRNLIPIISDISVLTQAHTNLYKKKGATTRTPGQDFPTVDGMNMDRLLDISNKLKLNTYIPSPVSQIMIPKPGKKKLRPLGIPAYDDKIVSEAMRLLLNAIYDPLFQKTNANHGFRPSRSPHTAIHTLSSKIQGLNLTINGDVDAAYPSVNHETLIKILRERIHDQKFLDLVWKFCRAGLYDFNTQKLEQTLLGVPQGQIASPIIFNIYFQKFDEKVIELLDEKTKETNSTRNIKTKISPSRVATGRKTQALPSKAYSTLNNNIYRANKRLNELINKNSATPFPEWPETEKTLHKKLNDQITAKTLERSKLNYSDKTQISIRYHYTRYADDWIIFTNGNTQFAENIKKELSEFLEQTLQMSLSLEKTKIIDITKEPTTFLGFAIGNYKKTNGKTQGSKVFINPDFERIITRLNLKSHCDPDGFPRESPGLSTQNPDVIISQCNTIMEGLINYYFPVITSPGQLQRIGYILQYSAYKTLAQKFKTSVRKIMKECGGPKNPQYPFEINGEIQKLPIHDYYWILENRPTLKENRDNFQYSTDLPDYETQIWEECLTRTKANWRTRRTLLYANCIICGSTKNVQSHHIRSVRTLNNKLKKNGQNQQQTLGFKYIMQLLNRKQVPLCRDHHSQVTHNKLDSRLLNCSISELYDYVVEQRNNSDDQ
jgi:retron-type reverse transcriptase